MDQKIQVKESLISKLKIFSKIASIVLIITQIIVLSGLMFDKSHLGYTIPGSASMEINTAIAFLLGGISLYLWMFKKQNHKIRRFAQICAFIMFLVGLFAFLGYLLNINLGIGQLFLKEGWTDISNFRIAPIFALNFMLLGYALTFINKKNHIKYTQLAAIIVGFVALFGLIGYVYNAKILDDNYTILSLVFTINFLILSLGVVFTRADHEFMAIVTSNYFGGNVADSLLPPAVVIPLLSGSLTLLGWKLSIYNTEFGISLMVLASIALFVSIIWWSADSFNKMDIKRKNAENKLKEYHDHLENLVGERTKELIHINDQLHTEITERRLMEEKIKLSLEEKELLLKEIHHRVKNNMQIISSLLNLQSKYIADENELEVFKESQNRVKSMALVHEKLYQSKDFERIDFGDYINSLAFNLAGSYTTQSIDFNINVRSVSLDINNAIPCGLIINEIITNSFKHAFPVAYALNDSFTHPNNKSGKIDIEFYKDNDEFKLIVSDNGIGFPEDLDFKNARTLGMQLVNTLVGQLNGTIELDRAHGTSFKISFKELMYKKRI